MQVEMPPNSGAGPVLPNPHDGRPNTPLSCGSFWSGVQSLPSAPKQPVHVMMEANRPQPRKDALLERGMAASVGRVRECPVLGYKFVVLAHNTIRGAAGAAVLNAELLLSEGLLD